MMKKLIVSLLLVMVSFSMVQAREISVTMNKVSTLGIGDSIGVVVVAESATGLVLTPFLYGMPAGDYVFSINETISCHASVTSTGLSLPAMAAGNSVWSLPDIRITSVDSVISPVMIDNVAFNDIRQRTLILARKSGSTLGFSLGNERVACGSLEQY